MFPILMKNQYDDALLRSWKELVAWSKRKDFIPRSEEDVRSFLYRGIVNRLGTAKWVHADPTRRQGTGTIAKGQMDFVDLELGPGTSVLVEVKFNQAKNGRRACENDLRKFEARYGRRKRVRKYVILYERTSRKTSSMGPSEFKSLVATAKMCGCQPPLVYPQQPSRYDSSGAKAHFSKIRKEAAFAANADRKPRLGRGRGASAKSRTT